MGAKTVSIASLIQTSIGPKLDSIRSAAEKTALALATSTGRAIARAPALSNSAFVPSSEAGSRARSASEAPDRANL
jgi:hypothetical protein